MSTCCAFTAAIQATSVLDPDVLVWRTSVNTNGTIVGQGTVSNASVTALNNFYIALKANAALFAKMLVINPCVADTVTSGCTPILTTPLGQKPWLMGNAQTYPINASCSFGVNGIRCDNALRGGPDYLPSTIWSSQTDTGITIYRFSDDGSHGGHVYDWGCSDGVDHYWEATMDAFGAWYWNNFQGSTGINPAAVFRNGYFSWNVPALNSWQLYFANSTTPHAAIISTTSAQNLNFPAFEIPGVGTNDNNVYGAIPSRFNAFIAFHKSLTATESAAFYALIQAFRTALGGGFV